MKKTVPEIQNLLDEARAQINTDPSFARQKASEALKISEASHCLEGQFESLFTLGRVCNLYNQSSESIEIFEKCYRIAEAMGDPRRKAMAVNARGVTYDNMLVHSKALECFLEALDITRKYKYQDLESKILNNVASVFSYLKEYQTALSYLLEAYQKTLGSGESIAVYLRNIANIYLEMEDFDKCYEYSILARNAAWRENDGEQRGDIYFFLALVFARRNKLRRAFRYFNLGFKLTKRNHCFHSHAEGCYDLARIFFEQKQYDSALKYLDTARELAEQYGYHLLLKDILKLSAEVFQMTGNAEKEIHALRDYIAINTLLESQDADKKKNYAQMQLSLFKMRKEQEYLKDQVYKDPLTGCLSYRDFEKTVQEYLKRVGGRVAVIFMDMDNLKPINDKYGHDAGDQLIIEFSGTIKEVLGNTGLIFRKGGDEFVVIRPFTSRDELKGFYSTLFARLSRVRIIGKTLTNISCSMGIAIAPDDSAQPAELVKMADMAMYRAKKSGKRCCCFYSDIHIKL